MYITYRMLTKCFVIQLLIVYPWYIIVYFHHVHCPLKHAEIGRKSWLAWFRHFSRGVWVCSTFMLSCTYLKCQCKHTIKMHHYIRIVSLLLFLCTECNMQCIPPSFVKQWWIFPFNLCMIEASWLLKLTGVVWNESSFVSVHNCCVELLNEINLGVLVLFHHQQVVFVFNWKSV